MSDDEYRSSMRNYSKAVFDGGTSGAIMFYSGDERYVVKQISKDECGVLQDMITDYRSHMAPATNGDHPADGAETQAGSTLPGAQHSLLPHIVQCVRIQMYATSLYFMVVENFLHHAAPREVHETYDLKGSWLNRNAVLPRKGQSARCRHCNHRYTVGEGFVPPLLSDDNLEGTVGEDRTSGWWSSGREPEPEPEPKLQLEPERRLCGVSANRQHAPRVTFKDGDLLHKVYLDGERRSARKYTSSPKLLRYKWTTISPRFVVYTLVVRPTLCDIQRCL